MQQRIDADEVKRAARGRWEQILTALAPQLTPAFERPGRHVPCPVHGGTDGFRLLKDADDSGGSVCNTCGVHSDGFSTLMWVTGRGFREILESVAEQLRVGSSNPLPARWVQRNEKTPEEDDKKARQSLNRVWTESISIAHRDAEPARLYLARRGISIRQPETLRFHPSLGYYDGKKIVGRFGVMVAMVVDQDGEPVTIHRTYLTPDGFKAAVTSPKKLMHHPSLRKLTGGAIRLVEAGPVLAVTEGLETALAVTEGTGLPVWPCVNAHLLEHFTPPDEVSQVLVFADKDRPSAQHPKGHGQAVAKQLVQRLWKMDKKASAIVPAGEIQAGQKSLDWLDILNRDGKAGFPSLQSVQRLLRRTA